MASQYDSIQTPNELLTKVAMHGFSTQIDDKLRAQDIFGRAPIEDLVELANTAGKTSENFYIVLFNIWHWTDATRFYNQHSNPDRKRIVNLENENNELSRKLIEAEKKTADSNEAYDLVVSRLEREKKVSVQAQADKAEVAWNLAEAEQEIIRLKAKLYDMMMAKEEK